MNQDHFAIFNSVLEYLSVNSHKLINFTDITKNALPPQKKKNDYLKSFKNFVFKNGKERKFDNYIEKIFIDNNNNDEIAQLVSNALYYLKQDGLVRYTPLKQHEYITVEITPKGLQKINDGGFKKENRKKYNFTWIEIIGLIISILGLCWGFYTYYYPNNK